MKKTETKNYFDLTASNNRYAVRIFKDGSQIQVKTGWNGENDFWDDVFFNPTIKELSEINDLITKVVTDNTH